MIIVPGGGLVEESRGEGVLDRSVVSQQHRVRRTFGPAQCIYIYISIYIYIYMQPPYRYIYIYIYNIIYYIYNIYIIFI